MLRKLIFILLAIGLLLTGCAPASAPTEAPAPVQTEIPAPTATQASTLLTFTDGLGREVTLTALPSRIVSLAPSNTEILFAVGAGDKIIARDSYSDYPPEALEIPDLGSGYPSFDVEAIIALEPDLVLVSALMPPEQIKSMEERGLTVFQVPNPQTLDDLYANLEQVGRLTGNESEAAALNASLRQRVETVQAKLQGITERPLVFYELDASQDANAPWTSGPGTFQDMLIEMAGGRNIGAVLQGGWAQISLEELLSQDPDVILLGDYLYGGVTPEQVAARPGWDALTAVKNGKVFTFDDNLVSRPGPRLVDGLEALAKLLHPDLFE